MSVSEEQADRKAISLGVVSSIVASVVLAFLTFQNWVAVSAFFMDGVNDVARAFAEEFWMSLLKTGVGALAVVAVLSHFGWPPSGWAAWLSMTRRLYAPDHLGRAFASKYAREEASHLCGGEVIASWDDVFEYLKRTGAQRKKAPSREPELGPRIYTSFVSYSELVQSLVLAALKKAGGRTDVVCFTTLNMPLVQWFNNKIDNSSEELQHTAIDKSWTDYLQFMADKVVQSKYRNKFILYRVALAYVGTDAAQSVLKHANELIPHYRTAILLKESHNPKEWVPPFSRREIAAIKEAATASSPDLANYIDRTFGRSESAYILAPPSIMVSPVRGYKWKLLPEFFVEQFCGPKSNNHAVVSLIDNDRFQDFFEGPSGRPQDIFLIGSRKKDKGAATTWRYALLATTDQNAQMVRVEFSRLKAEGENSPRFEEAIELVKNLTEGGDLDRPLLEWSRSLAARPDVIGASTSARHGP